MDVTEDTIAIADEMRNPKYDLHERDALAVATCEVNGVELEKRIPVDSPRRPAWHPTADAVDGAYTKVWLLPDDAVIGCRRVNGEIYRLDADTWEEDGLNTYTGDHRPLDAVMTLD